MKENKPRAEAFKVTPAILRLLRKAIAAELEYARYTSCGRKLGITGEAGEILVAHALGLRLVKDPRSKGFDAFDSRNRCIQIKTRRAEVGDLPKSSGRLSRFSSHPCHFILLGILNECYGLVEVWRAEMGQLEPIIARHKRRNPTIGQFKSVARQLYPLRRD